MKKLMILFLVLSLLVGCSDSGRIKIYNSEDVKLGIDIAVHEIKDGFLISYASHPSYGAETMSKILNKFKISALDVIDFSLQTKYSYDCVILVKKTTELENKISEYSKEHERSIVLE